MPSNRANELLTIHHQTPLSSQHSARSVSSHIIDHGQPTHCDSFVKSMYLHMSHISSFSNNYASNLKLKDLRYTLNPINKNCRHKVLKENSPRMCNVHYNWHIHVQYVFTQGPSMRSGVDCVCNACSVLVVHGYSGSVSCVPFLHVVNWINLHSTYFI